MKKLVFLINRYYTVINTGCNRKNCTRGETYKVIGIHSCRNVGDRTAGIEETSEPTHVILYEYGAESSNRANCMREATEDEILDYLVKHSGFSVTRQIYHEGSVYQIQNFLLGTPENYNIYGLKVSRAYKDYDPYFLILRASNAFLNVYITPNSEIKPLETFTFGDKKVPITMTSEGIMYMGTKLSIKYLEKLYTLMENKHPLRFDFDNRIAEDTEICFPQVKIGCTTFTKEEVEQVIITYKKLKE